MVIEVGPKETLIMLLRQECMGAIEEVEMARGRKDTEREWRG